VHFKTLSDLSLGAPTLDADMCAVFGAILYNASASLNTIELTHISPWVGPCGALC
jgi:hypothetical protein